MLLSMHIENIATIKGLDIDFGKNFNVLTGETGAGKSILIDSIGLLLGDRFEKTLIRTGETEAAVSGLIGNLSDETIAELTELGVSTDEEGCIHIARHITADGKSRARINGSAVSLSVLRLVGEKVMNILGQSDHQLLCDEKAYVSYLDCFADTDELLAEYGRAYGEMTQLSAKIKALTVNESEKMRLLDMYRYQIKDIDALSLSPGEDERLLEDEKRYKHAERIEKNARFTYLALKGAERGSATYILERCISAIEKISDVVPETAQMTAELQDCVYKIEDVSARMSELLGQFSDENPEAVLDKLESRLAAIDKLKKKYGNSVKEILAYAKELKEKVSRLTDADSEIEELENKKKRLLKELDKIAQQLHEKRVIAAKNLSQKVVENLRFMDLESVRFLVLVERLGKDENSYRANGADNVAFLISTNKGESMRPIAKVASGGELARIMLALTTVIADKNHVQTMIFDEIDTGVSGKTSRKLGIKLLELAQNVQVLCITHSAQVASLADSHYFVSKKEMADRTETSVSILTKEGQEAEIARILGGISITDAQRNAALDMLNEKENILSRF